MPSYVTVRQASLDDVDNVSALLSASYPRLLQPAYDATLLDQVLPRMTVAQPGLLQSGSYYVAEASDGAVVGCGGWTRERPGSGDIEDAVGHIRHFGVDPDWTRRGVGRALYARCRLDAQTAGIAKLECYSSLNGEVFYSALGFRRVGLIDVEMSDGLQFPSVHMVADI